MNRSQLMNRLDDIRAEIHRSHDVIFNLAFSTDPQDVARTNVHQARLERLRAERRVVRQGLGLPL